MGIRRNIGLLSAGLVLVAGLVSCAAKNVASTDINAPAGVKPDAKKEPQVHPLVQLNPSAPAANVYLLRPQPERVMGFPDNELDVELNQEKLLKLTKGQYTMVRLIPRDYTLTLKNLSEAGTLWKVREMSRNYPFNFRAGENYFLVIRPFDGEFRGVHFTAESVDIFAAKQIAQQLSAVGGASAAPIPSL